MFYILFVKKLKNTHYTRFKIEFNGLKYQMFNGEDDNLFVPTINM